ncbi:hypothetical protein F5880DRAFT_1481477 [Lentinula raphanica]|nr:hypothetical protein F5880DRAFT_1481477 [Lentinula raphanica]
MTHNSSRPSWLAGIEFLDRLHIPGFQKSLTAMQLANTLALSHILEHPTLSEMAYWIWNHQDLGAFLGLQKVGFMMPTQKAVLVALASFSRHIWNMNTTQLQIIGCTNGSVIDSEHFLCKIARWSSKIPQITIWSSNAEKENDYSRFPFALTAPRLFVENILAEIEVCPNF